MKSQRYGRSHPRSGFTPQEDSLLIDLVSQFGNDSWVTIASYMDKRNARQCKDRYNSYLSPSINKSPFSEEEDDLLRKKYKEIGPKWVKISKFFPNRTDISVKCRWAVLNRRDIKVSEKKGIMYSKAKNSNNAKRNDLDNISDNISSSSVDSDFVFEKDDNRFDNSFAASKNKTRINKSQKKCKNPNTSSKKSCLTMDLRKRKKHFDYNENNDNDDFDQNFHEQTLSKNNKPEEKGDNSSFETFPQPSIISSMNNVNDSSMNSLKSTNNNFLSIKPEEIQKYQQQNAINTQTFRTENHFEKNQPKFAPEIKQENANTYESISTNPTSLFDIFSQNYKDNEEIFMEYQTQKFANQINTETDVHECFDRLHHTKNIEMKNSTENSNKIGDNIFYLGNDMNSFQSNAENNQFIHGRKNSSLVSSAINESNNFFLANDKKKNHNPVNNSFADDFNWSICWDIQCPF